MLKYIMLSILFLGFTFSIYSEELTPTEELISKLKESKDFLKKIEKYGFEFSSEQIFSGKQLTVIGMIDNKVPNNSWFVLLDPTLLNMPLEGLINGEHFINSMYNKKILKTANCSFKLVSDANNLDGTNEHFVIINKDDVSNDFSVNLPKIFDTDSVSIKTTNIKTFTIKGKNLNFHYSYDDEKLVSIFINNSIDKLNRYRLYLYYEFQGLDQIKNLTTQYLEYAKTNNYLKIESVTLNDQINFRNFYILYLSIQSSSMSWKSSKDFSTNLDLNLEVKKVFENGNKNATFLRTKFLENAFSDDVTLKRWSGLLQNVQKMNSHVD